MPTREQLTNERLAAIVDLLAAEGIVTEKEARLLKSNREFGECQKLAEGLCKRRENSE
jgi:transcriptional regulator CtsR